jgi:hypothetical protein
VHFAPPNDTLTAVSASNLNQASIGIGSLPGSQTVTRHVKNVGGSTATYTASASVPGFDTVVSPASLTLAPGHDQTFTVTFSRTDAAVRVWAKGSLTWSDGTHRVRIPVALRPVPVAAPSEVHGAASASGSLTYSVTPGSTGPLANTVHGLVGVTPIDDSVATGPFDATAPAAGAGTKLYHVVVPAGTSAARFSLDSNDDTADLDVFVYRSGTLVGVSASGSADEQVTLLTPTAGTYDVYVNGFATPGGTTTYKLANFVVGTATVGNASVTPNPVSATQGVPVTLTASWSGLDAAMRWLGVIDYTGTGSVTLLSVG